MDNKQRYFMLFSVIAVAAFSQAAFADCQASQNCSLCDSGGFTVMCQCKDSANFKCTSCTPPNPCTGVGCRCGVSIPGNKSSCSAFACAGTGTCVTQLHRNEFLIAGIDDRAVSDAIAAEETSQAQSKLPHANILNLDPPISIGSDLGSEIVISDVALQIDSSALNGIDYKIRNNSAKAVVAFSVGFDIYWDISPDTPLHASNTQDGWFLGSNALESNQEEQERFTSSAVPQKPMHILRVEAVLDYAEFSDGSVYGVRATQLAKKFAESRQMKLDAQNHYAELLRKGLGHGQLLAQLEEDLPKTHGAAEHMALTQMRLDIVNHGPEHLASKILESQSLPVLNILSK